MEEILEIELTENTILDLPQNLFYNRINNYLLVISQNTANWIGLFNEEQERIFGLLYEKHTLGEVAQLSNNEEDFNFIVSQIVDKNFISTQSVKFNVPHNEGLYIYLTNDCNLSCTHCYMYSGKPKINELEKEEWIRIIKNAKNNGITAITFTGGEVSQYTIR